MDWMHSPDNPSYTGPRTNAEAAAELYGDGPNPQVPCPRMDTEGCEWWFWTKGPAYDAHLRDEHGATR